MPLTPERLLWQQQRTAGKQLLRLERFTDDLAVAIHQSLQARLTDLTSALDAGLASVRDAQPTATAAPIAAVIGGFSERTAKSNTDGMDELLVRIAELADKLVGIEVGRGCRGGFRPADGRGRPATDRCGRDDAARHG